MRYNKATKRRATEPVSAAEQRSGNLQPRWRTGTGPETAESDATEKSHGMATSHPPTKNGAKRLFQTEPSPRPATGPPLRTEAHCSTDDGGVRIDEAQTGTQRRMTTGGPTAVDIGFRMEEEKNWEGEEKEEKDEEEEGEGEEEEKEEERGDEHADKEVHEMRPGLEVGTQARAETRTIVLVMEDSIIIDGVRCRAAGMGRAPSLVGRGVGVPEESRLAGDVRTAGKVFLEVPRKREREWKVSRNGMDICRWWRVLLQVIVVVIIIQSLD